MKVMLTLVGGDWPQETITLGMTDQAALIEALCAEVRKRVPRLLDGAPALDDTLFAGYGVAEP